MIFNNIVMRETLQNNADWDCFKTPILQEILRIQIYIRWNIVCFRNPYVCSNQLDVLETNFSFANQQNQKSSSTLHGNTRQNDQDRGNPHKSPTRKKIHAKNNDVHNVDFLYSNVNSSRKEALLYVIEDNEAVIKMTIKGRSPTMRHVSRTHRVALGWLFDRINLDPKIQIKYIDTKNLLADILTKRKNHPQRMESSFVFVQHQPFQFRQ